MGDGLFITFEGGEGVGKTTQIKLLEKTLKAGGHKVMMTREPGGTPAAEKIRSLLSHPQHGGTWTAEAETMLLFAARAMHIRDAIAPALAIGEIILCDRYIDSTRVYQGHLQGIDINFLYDLEKKIVQDYVPHLTFILDLPAETAMERVEKRGVKDHYDRGNLAFYQALREGFLQIARDNPARCAIIDASQEEETIATDILDIVEKRLS